MDSDPTRITQPQDRTIPPPGNMQAWTTLFGTPSSLSQATSDSSASTRTPIVAPLFTQDSSTTTDNNTIVPQVLHFMALPRDYKSKLWQYFNLLDPNFHPPKYPGHQSACCKICNAILNVGKGRSGLATHIRHHEKNDAGAKAYEEQKRANKRKMELSLHAIPKKQPKDRDRDILDATVCWVIEENVPFNMVEKRSFRQMCTSLLSVAPVMTSSQIRNEIKCLGDVCKEAVQKELSNRHFALTTDHWTSPNNETYGCLTAHYILDSQLKRCVLHFEIHHGTTTGNALFSNLVQVFDSYQFEFSHILAITTDTTGNMNTFGRRLAENGVVHLYCIDHNLHLTSKLAFDDSNLPDAENAMKAARSQIEFFNSSTQAMEKLLNMQKTTRSGQKSLKLIQDVKTRWWSTWKMVQRLVQLTPSIDALIYGNQVKATALTHTQKLVLAEIESLLAPMAKAQMTLEGDKYPTISSVPFLIWKLRENLKARMATNNEEAFSASTRHLAQQMYLDFVERRYGDGSTVFHDNYVLGRQQRYISLHKIVIVAAFLDPRFKNLHPFVPETDRPKVHAYVVTLMQAVAVPSGNDPESRGKESTTEGTKESDIPSMNIPNNQETNMLFVEDSDSLFEELVSEPPGQENASVVDHTTLLCETELNRYKSIRPIHHRHDPLKWWSTNSVQFPLLSTLALRYLAIPATSASSERLWSRASNIITKSRTQLEGHVVADLIMLKENGHILKEHAESIYGRVRLLPTVYEEVEEQEKDIEE